MSAIDDAHKKIERLLTELKKKPFKDLQAFETNVLEETCAFGDVRFKITVWARKHAKEDKLGVIAEYRKQHLLGISTVGAVGFFMDATGVNDMKEEDLWDYGY